MAYIIGIIALFILFGLFIWAGATTSTEVTEPDVSTLDRANGVGILIPCPPEHGKHCTCTWY